MKGWLKVLVADLLLLLALYFVVQDEMWRSSLAATKGLSVSYTYSFFTHVFAMLGGSIPLRSPPIFDWIELILLLLVAVNIWFTYSVTRSRMGARRAAP